MQFPSSTSHSHTASAPVEETGISRMDRAVEVSSSIGPEKVVLWCAEVTRLERDASLARSPRLRSLLRYLFEESLAGRGERISQYTIAFECYALGSGFDAAANTMVRSHARRLRQALSRLAPSAGHCRIVMEERGYALRFESVGQSEATPPSPDASLRKPLVGVVDFQSGPRVAGDPSVARYLSTEILTAIGDYEPFSVAGPFASCSDEIRPGVVPCGSAEFLFQGEFLDPGFRPLASARLVEAGTGQQVWSATMEWDAKAGHAGIRCLARELVSRISGDWGVVSRRIARRVRAKPCDSLAPHDAVVLARDYLTHFHFEHLETCVRSLRQVALDSTDSAVPATLAVLLSVACSVEPRWSEPLDKTEIANLSARASRLDPECPWTRLAMVVSAVIDERRQDFVEMAKRAAREEETPPMLVGALGSLLCFQALEVDLGRRMIRRFRESVTGYPRLVHLALALCAFAEGNRSACREELASFGVPWGWAYPLVNGACAALEGDARTARSEWARVLAAYPDFPTRWRETIATQWHPAHLERIFRAFESVGVSTGCV